MRPHYVLDASVLVPVFYQDKPEDRVTRRAVMALLKQHESGEGILHVPDFCVAECAKALARLAFDRNRDFSDARDEYRQAVEKLLRIVSGSHGGREMRMSLKNHHLKDIEDIFLMEYALAPRDRKRLSGPDALLITMAKRHGARFGTDRVIVVTADAWLADVCNKNRPELPRAVNTLRDALPGGNYLRPRTY